MLASKSRYGISFFLLFILLLSVSASANSYLSSDIDQNYPFVFHWEQSNSIDAHVASKTGTNTFSDISTFAKPYHLGPPADYDGDDSPEFPVRTQVGSPYLRFYTVSGSNDFNVSLKPKSSSLMVSALIDGDGKTDLLFRDQNGDLSIVDSDGRSQAISISSLGNPIDVADIDRDGYEEIVYADSSANVKYYNFGSDPDSGTSTSIDPGNDKYNSYSTLADFDTDGRLEYVYTTGSSTVYSADVNGQENQLGTYSNAKSYPVGIYYNGSKPKAFVSGNSNNAITCTLSSCSLTGNSRKSSGARSIIPVFTDEPETNVSNGVSQGETVEAKFNSSDIEGYTDIEESTAKAVFKSPSGSKTVVSASEFTASSGIKGSTRSGGFVPSDSKSKAFKASYSLSSSAETGEWNVTVKVKDENMAGTRNWTTFNVESSGGGGGGGGQTGSSKDEEDYSSVQVSIAEKVAVDITPERLNYNLDPGSRKEITDPVGSDEEYGAVEIENIGSTNITHIWLNSSTPKSNPYGSGLSSRYDAGNFIQVKSVGEADTPDDSMYSFVNRKEFNESNDLSYIFTPTKNNDKGDWRYGRFRVNDQEIFWAVNASSSGSSCETDDNDGDDLRVGKRAHNKTNTGSNDFTESSEFTSYELQNQDSRSIATNVWVNTSEYKRQYDVVANCGSSETWIIRTRYNVQPLGIDLTGLSGVSSYLISGSATSENSLQPGEYFELETAVSIPLGVASGDLNSGSLKVLASSQ